MLCYTTLRLVRVSHGIHNIFFGVSLCSLTVRSALMCVL